MGGQDLAEDRRPQGVTSKLSFTFRVTQNYMWVLHNAFSMTKMCLMSHDKKIAYTDLNTKINKWNKMFILDIFSLFYVKELLLFLNPSQTVRLRVYHSSNKSAPLGYLITKAYITTLCTYNTVAMHHLRCTTKSMQSL